MLESQLRREIDTLSNSEGKLRQRCNELESLLGSEASEKDEYSLQLRTQESRIQALEKQLAQTEDEKTDLEIRLSSLTNMLKKNFGINVNGKSRRIIPARASSPVKGYFDDDTESGYSFNGNSKSTQALLPSKPKKATKCILNINKRRVNPLFVT